MRDGAHGIVKHCQRRKHIVGIGGERGSFTIVVQNNFINIDVAMSSVVSLRPTSSDNGV